MKTMYDMSLTADLKMCLDNLGLAPVDYPTWWQECALTPWNLPPTRTPGVLREKPSTSNAHVPIVTTTVSN